MKQYVKYSNYSTQEDVNTATILGISATLGDALNEQFVHLMDVTNGVDEEDAERLRSQMWLQWDVNTQEMQTTVEGLKEIFFIKTIER